jgi:hypothetical protein
MKLPCGGCWSGLRDFREFPSGSPREPHDKGLPCRQIPVKSAVWPRPCGGQSKERVSRDSYVEGRPLPGFGNRGKRTFRDRRKSGTQDGRWKRSRAAHRKLAGAGFSLRGGHDSRHQDVQRASDEMRCPSSKAMAVAIAACVLIGAGALTFCPFGPPAPIGGTSQVNVSFSETEAQIGSLNPCVIIQGPTVQFDFSADEPNLSRVDVSVA